MGSEGEPNLGKRRAKSLLPARLIAASAVLGSIVLLSLAEKPVRAAALDDADDSGVSAPAGVPPAESILAEYTPQAPPNPAPPPYTLLRFNEDYSYLSDPALRSDFFDAVKYIPLSDSNRHSFVSLGGDLRERYENFSYPGFGVGRTPSHDDYVLQRIDLHVDVHLDEHWRLFAQAISGYDWGSDRTPPPTDHDPIDLQQAFVDLRGNGEGKSGPEYFVVRTGRFEMSYGSGRLVATRQAPNIPFKFDGVQFIGAAHDAKIYAFVAKPARERKTAFDDEYPHQLFGGLYATTPVISQAAGLKADIYYLYFRDQSVRYATGVADERRDTIGTRLFGKVNGFDYDVEPIVQLGRFGARDILAWTVGSSFGYTFEAIRFKPRVGANLDIVSGDESGSSHFGTFNPLYFKAGYFNDASLLRPSNLIDVHPTMQFKLPHATVLTVGSDVLWRYSRHDGLYGPSGNLELPAGGSSRYVATTAEVAAQWQISRHLSLIGSWVRFFTSNYVRTATGHDVDFFGAWATFTF